MFKAKTVLTIFMALASVSPVSATGEATGQASAPERISFLVTFGDEKCPVPVADEIVVCAVQPEGDRYRIPRDLREDKAAAVSGGSWTSAVESLDSYSRAVLPNSCSVNGSGGFTGCTQKLLQQWFAERRGKLQAN